MSSEFRETKRLQRSPGPLKRSRFWLPNADPSTVVGDTTVPYKVLMKFWRGKESVRPGKVYFWSDGASEGSGIIRVGDFVHLGEWGGPGGVYIACLDRADVGYDPLSIDEDGTFVSRPHLQRFLNDPAFPSLNRTRTSARDSSSPSRSQQLLAYILTGVGSPLAFMAFEPNSEVSSDVLSKAEGMNIDSGAILLEPVLQVAGCDAAARLQRQPSDQ